MATSLKEKCQICDIKSAAVGFLDENQLQLLAENCAEASFKKGEIIFKQNSLSSNIIYLKEGLVKTYMEWHHKGQILNILKAPAYLGIPTTIGDKVNHFSAAALQDTVACFIDINTFKMLIDRNGKFAYEIILYLCKNELQHHQRCLYRTQKHVNGLVADTLLFFSQEIYRDNVFVIPISRSEFGDLIGTTKETVSRVLNEFDKDGLIEIKGKTIKLLDQDMIAKISENG
ncbi:MAG: Crp/Fnr family transcriptional regulator [Bacteroidetes bacterium]|nr:MAG: Crp/Fnr family transcriptional regulator [Bacteroidota bacterium]